MAAIKTLTDTNGILKERILHAHCYQYTKQPYLSTNKQSGSTSVPGYILKYLAISLLESLRSVCPPFLIC